MREDRRDPFDESLERYRAWTEEEAEGSLRAARARLAADLERFERGRTAWRRVAAAAATVAVALGLAYFALSRRPVAVPPGPATVATVVEEPSAPERVLVHRLRSGTTLYIVLSGEGRASKEEEVQR